MTKDQPLLAVLIDADNIPAKHAAAILEEITRYGEPALRRVYGDWASDGLKGWREQVRELGMVAQQETANTTGKNASDIGLVIDAMDILHKGRFDGFVLVSSDSDFTALANRLREDGVEVIGIGEKKAPVSLRNVCNRFILIENIVDTVEETDVKGATPKETVVVKQPTTKVVPLVLKAMKDIDADEEWFRLGEVGSFINRTNPDFDVRTYGSTKLSDLLRQTGHFEVQQKDGQLKVRRKPRPA
jgi:hypothetical protein